MATQSTETGSSSRPHPSPPPNQISCLICRQRKVKCDKQARCSHCIKSRVECVYGIPARPRRRFGIGKSNEDTSKEELLHRLKQYEALCNQHGLKLGQPGSIIDENQISDAALPQPTTTSPMVVAHMRTAPASGSISKPKRTEESNVWSDLSGYMLKDYAFGNATPTLSFDGLNPFDTGSGSLTALHPPATQIFKLWEKFLENVNPLIKIIHVPLVQRDLLNASLDLKNVSKPLEALMFAIYASAINSLSNEECTELAHTSKSELQDRFFRAAQHALVRAGIIGTLDIVVLQAALLLLNSVIYRYQPGEFWVLIGIALRVGQRIGLHHKTYPPNISVIESQVRRRIWWQIVVLDGRTAQWSKVKAPVMTENWDVPLPLNVNDCDLTPEMTVEPRDYQGITEMTLRLMLYEIGKFVREAAAAGISVESTQRLPDPSAPIPKKDKAIDDLEKLLEAKYLIYCDPAIPLHILTRCLARVVCARLRFIAHRPMTPRATELSDDEKQTMFNSCLLMIEQYNYIRSLDCLRGFIWNFDLQVDPIVYLLAELRSRNPDPLVEKAWSEISKVFKNTPHLVFNDKTHLHIAIGNLALASWESYENRRKHFHPNKENAQPEFITQIIQHRTPHAFNSSTQPVEDNSRMALDPDPAAANQNASNLDFDFDSSPMFDPMAPIDWNYWNNLIQDAGLYTFDNTVLPSDIYPN